MTRMLQVAEGKWSVWQRPNAGHQVGRLGWPGLWKVVAGGTVFELPPLSGPEDGEEALSDEKQPLGPACAAWAERTARGKVPEGWQPPPRDEVEAWFPATSRTVHSGPWVRQIELVHEPGRLALTCPVLLAAPGGLSDARRMWLHELFADARDRWRLVRVELSDAAALAEVDLTGVPPRAAECVFRTGLEALRWAVTWLVQSAAFVADAETPCRALEVCPVRG